MRILRILFKFGAFFVKRTRQIARKVWLVKYWAVGFTLCGMRDGSVTGLHTAAYIHTHMRVI